MARRMRALIIAAVAAAASSAEAAETLQNVTSPVIQAEGSQAALAKRATVCLTKNIRPEKGGQPVIQASDPESGTVVAAATFTFTRAAIAWTARSTLTVETKDGRFRLVHTALQHRQGSESPSGLASFLGTNPRNDTWTDVGMWWGAGGETVKREAEALSAKVADCIKAAPKDDW